MVSVWTILVASFVLVGHTSALRHGFAPQWLVDKYCTGVTALVKVPWDCGGYLHCYNVGLTPRGTWFECAGQLQFDENINACVNNPTGCENPYAVASSECVNDPTARFPHPSSCAMFYDCSQTQKLDQYNLGVYENECPHPQLFDPDIGTCSTAQQETIICENKPATRCDYRKECVQGAVNTPCTGRPDGENPKPDSPPFSTEYIMCSQGQLISSHTCPQGSIFDLYTRMCALHISESVQRFCAVNPKAVFPDALNCAKYYNCSLPYPYRGLDPFQAECLYRYLFDTSTMSCVLHYELQTPCGNRFEPIDPCEYKVGHCIGRTYCILCQARCKGKVDGPHPLPNYPNTRFHMTCQGGRLWEILRCVDGEIYYHELKKCRPKELPAQPPTTTTTTTTTTKPPQVVPGVCTCSEELTMLSSRLTNFSTSTNEMFAQLKVGSPFDCDEPPIVSNSVVELSYEDNVAVATYTCDEGYEVCRGAMRSTCSKHDIWDLAAVGSCVPNKWMYTNTITFPCEIPVNSIIKFTGRSTKDTYTFKLLNNTTGQEYLYVRVSPTTEEIQIGSTSTLILRTLNSPTDMKNEVIWTISVKAETIELFINDEYVYSVPRTLGLITSLVVSDGFLTEETHISYKGHNTTASGKYPLMSNLALHKAVKASSSAPPSTPGHLTDGYSHVQWGDNSCWSSSGGDSSPNLLIDLGKEFYISHLIVTSPVCENGGCGKGLWNFIIEVLHEDPSVNKLADRETCFNYKTKFPPMSIEKIQCDSDVIGRYVMITFNGPIIMPMTMCEVEVYGGLQEATGWSPFSCPDPPIIEGASVQVSYTHFEAMAIYTCSGSDVICTGNDVIHCKNETGWDAKPGMCLKTEHEADIYGALPDFYMCPLRLGSGVELWMTLTGTQCSLVFYQGDNTLLQLDFTAGLVALYQYFSSDITPPTKLSLASPFTFNKESHVVISALSDHLLIEVDGDVFYQYDVETFFVDSQIYVESTDGLNIRKARVYPLLVQGAVREPVEENLVQSFGVKASSVYANPETFVADGNPGKVWNTGSCWNAQIGDKPQWFDVILDKQYYIKDLIIDLRSMSDASNFDVNLALGKQAYGSGNYDSKSSQGHPVDGILTSIRSQGSCYTSSVSEPDPWWMVDLGQEYTVSSVAIQTSSDGNDTSHSDLSLVLYDVDPQTTANAKETTCNDIVGVLEPFARIPCVRPTTGRYLKVMRMMGVSKGVITLCEVQVYAALESKLHDFTVNVYVEDPELNSDAVAKQCTRHTGEFPKDAPTNISCSEDVWGRYMRVQSDVITVQYDQMTICEIEVYGDVVIKREWSPYDCGPPPLVTNGHVSVSYSPDKAVATYRCFKGFAACYAPTVVTCTEDHPWPEHQHVCLERIFSAYHSYGLDTVDFCPLRLGETLKLYFIPETAGDTLTFGAGTQPLVQMKFTSTFEVTFTTGYREYRNESTVQVGYLPFVKGKESVIIVTALTNALYFEVEDKSLYLALIDIHRIRTIKSTSRLGKLTISSRDNSTALLPTKENLAFKRLRLSSTMTSTSGLALDGMASTCWSSAVNDLDSYWMVNLEKFVYVSHVTITTSSACTPECNKWTHDFKIEMFHKDPEPGDIGDLCLEYGGVLPHSTTTTLHCVETMYGRVLKISAPDRRSAEDTFTLCEVEVYGGHVIRAETPRNLALFGKVMSSSEDVDARAVWAVDGIEDDRLPSRTTYESNSTDSSPWWQVELNDFYSIYQVELLTKLNSKLAVTIEVSPTEPKADVQKEICFSGKTRTGKLTCEKRIVGKYVRISSKSLLALVEVKVYGDAVLIHEPTLTNLAKKRPASSSSRHTPPSWANDGNRASVVEGNSCWLTEKLDKMPWLMIELDDLYQVTLVKLVSGTKACPTCSESLQDFIVETFTSKPTRYIGETGHVCLDNPGAVPHATMVSLECDSPVFSRFIRLKSRNMGTLIVCEMEVYGSKVEIMGWTPSSCPEPPLLSNACVDVCYHDDRAVATYTCDTNYTMCTGSNTLTCSSEAGWEGSPGTCVQTTIEDNAGHSFNIRELQVCNPKLGEGFELWVTPEASGSRLEFLNDHAAIMALKISFVPDDTGDGPVTLQTSSSFKGKFQAFRKNEESKVIVVYVTGGLLVQVDDKYLMTVPHADKSSQIAYIRAKGDFRIRKIQPLKRYPNGIIRVPLVENLAYKKPTDAVSMFMAEMKPSHAVDGVLENVMITCWHPGFGFKDQWLTIDLGDYYFVREVHVLNRRDVAARTHDYLISLLPSTKVDERALTCAFYEGIMPLGAMEAIQCKQDVWGRVVRFIKRAEDVDHMEDVLTLCEIEVYGDKVIRKPWTIEDCPPVPYHLNAVASVSYANNQKIATYTCKEGFSMCTGKDEKKCASEAGWENSLDTCVQTTLEIHYGYMNDLRKFPICPMALGEGIEMFIEPYGGGTGSYDISLKLGETGDTAMKLTLFYENRPNVLVESLENDLIKQQSLVSKSSFVRDTEFHVAIIFQSYTLLVLVDGKVLFEFGHTLDTTSVSFVDSSPRVGIRMVKPLSRYHPLIERSKLPADIAHGAPVHSGSIATGYSNDKLTDGMESYVSSNCWRPKAGEQSQYIRVDLGAYYFVREVELTGLRENIAYNKTGSASPSYDNKGNPNKPLDGTYGNNRFAGDCYTSQKTGERWWMVDLGEQQEVYGFALQGRQDASYAAQTSDLTIDVYAATTDIGTPVSSKCLDLVGPAEFFKVYECTKPVTGRYVRVTKTLVNIDPITLCEVQVFGKAARLGDGIVVEVLPSPELDRRKRCAIYEDDKGTGSQRLRCKDNVWGRYILVNRFVTDGSDMVICEVKVFGDEVILKAIKK